MIIRTRLKSDDRGATLIEFALICPVLLLMILGLFDMGYNYYVLTQLQGAVQKAARDSSVENAGGSLNQIDGKVAEAVRYIAPEAEVAFKRSSYASFSDIGQPEDYSDINGDDRCNDGEPFEDANQNGVWDEDRGSDGLGGARDAVLYIVDIEFPRVFGTAPFLGLPETVALQATTVLRNQPYSRDKPEAQVGSCI